MQSTNPSPSLHNEDLAPATERKWGAFSIFNVWTSDVHSLWGYYLAAEPLPSVRQLPQLHPGDRHRLARHLRPDEPGGERGRAHRRALPVLARASFGTFGANVPALVRAVVACFWYGAQTSAASGGNRGIARTQRCHAVVSPEQPHARTLHVGGDLLRQSSGHCNC